MSRLGLASPMGRRRRPRRLRFGLLSDSPGVQVLFLTTYLARRSLARSGGACQSPSFWMYPAERRARLFAKQAGRKPVIYIS